MFEYNSSTEKGSFVLTDKAKEVIKSWPKDVREYKINEAIVNLEKGGKIETTENPMQQDIDTRISDILTKEPVSAFDLFIKMAVINFAKTGEYYQYFGNPKDDTEEPENVVKDGLDELDDDYYGNSPKKTSGFDIPTL